MGESEECALHFENHSNFSIQKYQNFFEHQAFVDVTIICNDGKKIKAHRLVLAAYSSFFENVLAHESNTLVIVDSSSPVVEALLEFIYKGSVNIPKTLLPNLLKTGKDLRIQGLQYENYNCHVNSCQSNKNSKENGISLQDQSEILANISSFRNSTQMENIEESKHSSMIQPEKETSPIVLSTLIGKIDKGVKVINPFSVKQRTTHDSDSTCVEDNNFPACPSNIKETENSSQSPVPSGTTYSLKDDSDVEFIEETASVVVVNESQEPTSPVWFRKTQPKNKGLLREKKCKRNADNDKVSAPVTTKRIKGSNRAKDDCSTSNKDKDSSDSNSVAEESKQELSSQLVENQPANSTEATKVKSSVPLTDNSIKEKTFRQLFHYCLVCKSYKKNIKDHIRRSHVLSLRRRKFSCEICSKKYFLEHSLRAHKCLTARPCT